MAGAVLCTIYITNNRSVIRPIGQTVLMAYEKQFIDFYTLDQVISALRLHNQGEITIGTKIPDDVIQMIQDSGKPVTSAPNPTVSREILTKEEFNQFLAEAQTHSNTILTSPNGTTWKATIDDSGNVTWVKA